MVAVSSLPTLDGLNAADLLDAAPLESVLEQQMLDYLQVANSYFDLQLEASKDEEELLLPVAYSVAERAKMITATTINAMQALIDRAMSEGWTPQELAFGRGAEPGLAPLIDEVYRGRSLSIATTELNLFHNIAAVERYSGAGFTYVLISDGPGCGWTTHDDPDKADDTFRDVADVFAYPLAHQNCRRQIVPASR